MSPKRACNTCISRRVKCSGSLLCDTCRRAVKRVRCTYLRPAHRRGPKSRRVGSHQETNLPGIQSTENLQNVQDKYMRNNSDVTVSSSTPAYSPQCIPKTILASGIRLYQQYSYSVWPVVNIEALLERPEDIYPGRVDPNAGNTSCLIMALCAATMAQLHLDPLASLDVRSVLVPFFLHVYYTKVNQRNSAMMYIQEAMTGARLLRLNEEFPYEEDELVANMALVFRLLWISERGYSLHLGLSPSYIDPPELINFETSMNADVHAQGLLELVKLFIAFNQISVGTAPLAWDHHGYTSDRHRDESCLTMLQYG
ncbi:unnamed protein product [Penicillium nalgiovense]|nr:unnamed protein product [Penicillium nalgiovense]